MYFCRLNLNIFYSMNNLKYNLSFWERETFLKDFDVAIIGSGIVGLSAAIHLKKEQPDLNVVVFERGPLPIGASTRNAGFACFGSMTELMEDLDKLGETAVFDLVTMRWEGLKRLREVCGDWNLGYEPKGGFEMFTDDEEDVYRHCQDKMEWFNEKLAKITGEKAVFSDCTYKAKQFGFRGVNRLIHNQAEGQVHTGRMMATLIRLAQESGVTIFNGMGIDNLEDTSQGVVLQSEFGWSITVPKILIAVNGFAKKLLPQAEVYPARNQVLITKPMADLPIEGCFHYDRGYYYFRNIDGRILLGGGRHLDMEAERTDQFGSSELVRSALTQLLKTVILPGRPVEIDGWWSGILGLGPQKKPIIEHVSPNVVVSVRLSGMGVAIGTLVGKQGADLVLGRKI
jgi:gamma-glutamylputrescine oxidase